MQHRIQQLLLITLLAISAPLAFAPSASADLPEVLAQLLMEELEDLGGPLSSPAEENGREPAGFGYECAGDITVGPFWIRKTSRRFSAEDAFCEISSFVVTVDDELITAFEGKDAFSWFVSRELDPENDSPELFVSFHSTAIREPHSALIVTKLPNGRWDTIAIDRVSDRSNNGLTNVRIEGTDLIVGMDDHSIFTEGVEAASFAISFRPLRLYKLREGRLIEVTFDAEHRDKIRAHLRETIQLAVTNASLGSDQPEYHSLGFWASYAAAQATLGDLHLPWVRLLSRIDFVNLEASTEEVPAEPTDRSSIEGRLIGVLRQNGYVPADWLKPAPADGQEPRTDFGPFRAPKNGDAHVLVVMFLGHKGGWQVERTLVSGKICDILLGILEKRGVFTLSVYPIDRKGIAAGRVVDLACLAPDGTRRNPRMTLPRVAYGQMLKRSDPNEQRVIRKLHEDLRKRLGTF